MSQVRRKRGVLEPLVPRVLDHADFAWCRRRVRLSVRRGRDRKEQLAILDNLWAADVRALEQRA